MLLRLLIDNGLDGAVGIVEHALYLQRTQVRDVVRGYAVVIEQIPLSLELCDRVVGSPSDYRLQNDTLIDEGAIGIIA